MFIWLTCPACGRTEQFQADILEAIEASEWEIECDRCGNVGGFKAAQ